jgi:hypothetical protein
VSAAAAAFVMLAVGSAVRSAVSQLLLDLLLAILVLRVLLLLIRLCCFSTAVSVLLLLPGVVSSPLHLLQQAQQHVCVHAALMRLIYND